MTARHDTRGITGVILAGGRGRRMGGADKGLVEFRGRPLVEHVIDAIRSQVDAIMINANRNLPNYERYGYPLVPDGLPGHPGPLAGMLAGLQKASTDSVLFVPCDTPALPADLAQRLSVTMLENKADICIPGDGMRSHPVIALMKCTLQQSLQAYLIAGGRRVEDWVLAQNHAVADFSDSPASFHNLNHPDDL